MKAHDLHSDQPAVAEALDEYLVQFRDLDDRLLSRPPAATPAHAREQAHAWKRRALVRAVAPAPVRRGYHRARSLARQEGRGRILPDFLLIGAAKCGTTSLFDWMCEHPFIARPMTNGQPRKELLYFDYFSTQSVGWYRAHFPRVEDRRAFERQNGRLFLTGEATATYLTHPWAPVRAAKVLPDAKLIVTLRNPVDRAYSAFQMSRREGLEPCESFEAALALESARLDAEEARVKADPSYSPAPPAPLGYWSYLQRSRYAQHVARWFEFYPREQFLFVEFEQLVHEPRAALDRVYEFLGLPGHEHDRFPTLNAGDYGSSIKPETRDALIEYFRPHNERLRQLTGIDFGWDR